MDSIQFRKSTRPGGIGDAEYDVLVDGSVIGQIWQGRGGWRHSLMGIRNPYGGYETRREAAAKLVDLLGDPA